MDEIADALKAASGSRPLPPSLRDRLEAMMLHMEEETAMALAGVGGARSLPSAFREKMWEAMVARPRAVVRFPVGLPSVRMLSALGAVAALLLGVFAISDEQLPSSPGTRNRPSASPPETIGPPAPREELPLAIVTPDPKESPPREAVARGSQESYAPSRAGSTSSSEICFPEEMCPVYSAFSPSGPEPSEPEPQRVPPSPPRDVQANSGPGVGEITISWSPPSEQGSSELRKFALYRQQDGGAEKVIAILDVTKTSFVDGGLSFGNYRYRLKARNRHAISDFSASASAYAVGTP